MGLPDKEWIVVWDESPTPMADLVRLLCFFSLARSLSRLLYHHGLGCLFCDGGGTTPLFSPGRGWACH